MVRRKPVSTLAEEATEPYGFGLGPVVIPGQRPRPATSGSPIPSSVAGEVEGMRPGQPRYYGLGPEVVSPLNQFYYDNQGKIVDLNVAAYKAGEEGFTFPQFMKKENAEIQALTRGLPKSQLTAVMKGLNADLKSHYSFGRSKRS